MSKALPYIAAAGTFLATGSFQAAQAAFFITSLAVNALDPPKKPGAAERQASVTTLSLGEQSRELLIGETCTAGTLVDAFNFGGKYGTDTVTRCIAVADHAIDSVVGYYIGDQYYPWTVDGIQPGFSNKLSIRFYNATADGHAPQAHVLAAGWSASDRLAGMAVFWVDTQYDEKVWPQGHPQFKFVLRGLRAYDMRFDPAFGYTGPNPQTWENRASHVHTRNAAILRYAFTRGIYAEGHQGDPDYLLIGRGLTPEEAPPERIIAAANLCDEVLDGGGRYTANGVIRASDAFITVEEMFSAAMAGQIVQREGGVEVEPGQAKAAVVTITDGDLVVGEPVSYSAFLPDSDGGRINSVTPRYVSPAQNWRDFAGPVRRDVADIAADGGPREATLSLLLVTDGAQADRCAEIMRKAARLERRATIVLPPEYANLEEGDWIAWRSDRYHDGATVRYRIESWTLDEKWRMRLSLREIASSVFGVPDPVEDAAPPPPPPPVPVDALILDGVTAEAITLPGDTSAMPAVRFTWSTPVDAAVLAIRAEVRRAGETEIATGRADDISLGGMVMSNGVPADAAIEARLVPIGDPSRPVLASPWIPLSTTSLVAGDVSATSPTISAINDAIAAVEAGSDAAVASLNAAIYAPGTGLLARSDAMFADINTATTGLKAQTTSLLASLNTPTTGVLARLTTVENSSSTGISAAASRITALEATVNTAGSGVVARLATAESAIATNNAAAVSRLSALETTINTAGTGLSARTSTLETANTNLAANKADASRVATIEADLNTASTGLKARTTAVETATSNLATSKADATRVTALEATVNTAGTGLSARLGTAESAIATNNAAAVSRLGTLEATVNTAGTGLSARTSTLETATTNLTANKADATRVTALEATINTAGTGLSARLATVESAVTTNNTAAVTRLSLLEAAAGGDALNLNSTFANFASPSGLAPNLTATDVPAASYSRTTGRVSAYAQRVETTANVNLQGFRWAWPTNNWRSFLPERGGGDYWVLEYKIEASSGGIDGVGFGFEIIKGDGSAGGGASYLIGLKSLVGGGVGDDVICEGSHFFRADRTQARTSANLWFYGANNGFPTYNGVAPGGISAAKRLYVHRLSIRAATEAEISAQVALPAVSARLTTAESAITTNNSAATSRLTSLEATVNTVGTGVTARLTTVESVAASANGTAKAIKGVITDVNGRIGGYASSNDGTTTSFEILASVFGIRDTGSGLRTEYRSGIWYVYDPDAATRTMYGKAFGGANKLTWWTGPASVAEGSETKANAYVFISTVAPRFGGTDTPGGGVFTASAPGVRVKTQIGGTGAITTPSVPITVAGNTGTVTYSWSVVFGDIDGITISSATSANPTFSANPAGVARLQAIWAWTATDSGTGITRGGQTYVTIQRDA